MKCRLSSAALWLVTISGYGFAQGVAVASVRESLRDSFPESYSGIETAFNSSSEPELLSILASEDEGELRPKAAGVLGVVGDENAVDALIEVIERPIVGPVYISQFQHDVRREAMRALGFLAGRTNSQRALDYLIQSLDDSIWRRRNIQGVTAYLDTYELYDKQLSIYAIMGLALSGQPRATGALQALRDSPRTNQARLRNGLDDLLDTWLEVNSLVSEGGAASMFDHFEAARQRDAERQVEDARQLREALSR